MDRRDFLQTMAAAPLLSATAITPLLSAAQQPAERPQAQTSHQRDFFYRPINAWAADFIPFYAKGKYQLFYLLDWRDHPKFGEGTPWFLISTNDFVNFTEHGEILPRGTKEQQDLYVFTGCVIEANGQYHIFYTGHNPHFRKQGKPEQGVMHAVSDDLLKWKKVPEHTFFAPPDKYEPHDWRDPFVFWNEEAGEYWMLLAARFKTGIPRRRGLTALCASKDLVNWEVREPFYAPNLYFTHECPDLFKIGDWWYLVFSEFTDLVQTRYRMSRSLKGPWLTPKRDSFDARAFYAAKTASDGRRRFIFGWDPSREESKDYHRWNWGGNLVVHEVHQAKDGELYVTVPDTVDQAFNKQARFSLDTKVGDLKISDSEVQVNAQGSFAAAAAGLMPDRCKIETTIQFEPNTRGCGLMLRASDDLESVYYVRLEPQNNRLVFDSWPRGTHHPITSADGPFMLDLERQIELNPNQPVELKVFVDGTVAVIYAAGKIALSTRLYNLPKGKWGVFVNEGSARFRNLKLTTT